jgi:peptidyl-prolyl cis-trans isomerase SurA
MKKRLLILTLLNLAIFLAAPRFVAAEVPGTPAVRTADRIVARVGSEPITMREVQFIQADNPSLKFPEALNILIERRLVLGWAKENGIKVSPEELDKVERSLLVNNNLNEDRFQELLASRGQSRESFREDLEEQVIVNKALSAVITQQGTVTREEILERYESLHMPREAVRIRHILLKTDPASGRSDEVVLQQAADIIGRIQAGASFESMAQQYSDDGVSASTGGELGTFRKGELLPELETLAFTLKPGETGGPVKTSAGYHILKVEDRSASEPPPLSDVEAQIHASLVEEKGVDIRNRWLKDLREAAFIEIFTDEE